MRLLTVSLLACAFASASPEQTDIEQSKIQYTTSCDLDITNGGIVFEAKPTVFYPKGVDDVQKIIKLARKHKRKVRAVGSMHSLNPCCLTNDYVISLKRMNRIVEVGKDYVTVEAGIRVRDLCKSLERSGLTLEVLGSIAEQTISGAISTGTRGQVPYAGSLGSQVIEMEIVNGNGDVSNLSLKHDPKQLLASVTSLGMLGVVTKLTLKCKPLFLMAEVIRRVEMSEVLDRLESMLNYDKLVMYWNIDSEEVKVVSGHRVNCDILPTSDPHFKTLGIYPHMHSMEGFSDTLQRVGKSWEIITMLQWTEEKSRRRVNVMKKEGTGIFQSDYSVPIKQLPAVIEEARKFFRNNRQRLRLAKDRMVVEIRAVKQDKVWLSPSYGRDSISLCFHDFERPLVLSREDADQFIEWETILKKQFDVRPHLGKCHFFSDKELSRAFPKWSEFKRLRKQADPKNIFLTEYLESLLK